MHQEQDSVLEALRAGETKQEVLGVWVEWDKNSKAVTQVEIDMSHERGTSVFWAERKRALLERDSSSEEVAHEIDLEEHEIFLTIIQNPEAIKFNITSIGEAVEEESTLTYFWWRCKTAQSPRSGTWQNLTTKDTFTLWLGKLIFKTLPRRHISTNIKQHMYKVIHWHYL